ncbi:MAG: hypothetical protein IJW36_00440 [Clostridia bacterium]|nr:hypothetical protein [Clostridia bacterium]
MTKKNKNILICSILLFFVVSLFSSFIIYFNFNQKEEVSAATTYSISDLSSLQSFISKVNNGEIDANAKLTADINCYGTILDSIGRGVEYYAGTFDGAGFKIYNFKTDYITSAEVANAPSVLGFFGYTDGATIKNLRLTSFTHAPTIVYDYSRAVIGGLVGYAANTKITNCQVDNFSITNFTNADSVYVGGIVGMCELDTTISNCYVTAFDYSGPYVVSGLSHSIEMFFIGGLVGVMHGKSLDQCVFDPSDSEWTLTYTNTMPAYKDYANGKLIYLYQAGQTSYSDDYVKWFYISGGTDNVYDCYYNPGQHYFRGIELKSSVGGKEYKDDYGDSYPWYYATSYNAFPLLRMFISWTEWIVKTSNSSASKIIGSSPVWLPSDMSVTISDPTATSISVGGNSFSISITNSDYIFIEWQISGSVITAKVEIQYGTIKLSLVDNANLNVTQLEYKVHKGTTITVEVAGNKSYVQYSFQYNGSLITVKYTASNPKYYVSNQGISATTVSGGATVTIAPTFALKSYSITLG